MATLSTPSDELSTLGNQADASSPKSGVDSIRQGNFGITFANGVRVSIFFAAGSYSDNSELDFSTRLLNGYQLGPLESTNAEVMITDGPDRLIRWFERKFGNNPASRLTPTEILLVLNRAAKVEYKVTDLQPSDQDTNKRQAKAQS